MGFYTFRLIAVILKGAVTGTKTVQKQPQDILAVAKAMAWLVEHRGNRVCEFIQEVLGLV
ncbi:hypothetical protein NDI37_02840 [Funiculus sociatus GB2-A5]|jgi:hypothetical protein|uniref:Uncharacterized protein n=1 Tax=Funiculus sociatus GB2-A5 TaxID=2933946 RepID=A0ABV0JJ13_9CYAN|nr:MULTISPECIES: hypothetical protein [unclassified Trichocoleus]MBD1907348.1 hypothetical protein [Trichocoleus sp. FACHB-832]MBD2062534.1 hypothetical protein [Trichocoleus sp. FACHB-6]